MSPCQKVPELLPEDMRGMLDEVLRPKPPESLPDCERICEVARHE